MAEFKFITLPDGSQIAELKLTKGYSTIVDAEDVHLLDGWTWRTLENGRKRYAIGYRKPQISVRLHRVLFECTKGDGIEIDHIDGDGLNNRRKNLRIASGQQNSMNKKKYRGTSKYKGVCWDSGLRLWRTEIVCNGKKFRLRSFESEEDAAKEYNVAARRLFGEFACLSPVEGIPPKLVLQRNKTSRFLGVCRSHKTWRVQINYKGKVRQFGTFDDEVEAAKAYNSAAISLFGESARLNEL